MAINRIHDFIRVDKQEISRLFRRINTESVLCHGDMIYSNTLIAGNKPYFIDFEFVHAGSPYQDIGKFFRTKAPEIQSLIDCSLYVAFADGYNAAASSPLPVDWLRLAHLCDIEALLCLINRDSAPAEWIADVEYDIQRSLREGHPAP